MPSKSKSQQRLFGMALALKRGDLNVLGLDSKLLSKLKEISKLPEKDLRDFAETKHDDLDESESVATTSNVNGMGAVEFPGNPSSQSNFETVKTGSGDLPHGIPSKKQKKKLFKRFRDWEKLKNK